MLDAVPTVDELKLLGLENLIKLQGLLEDIISNADEDLVFLKQYHDNALVALSLSDPRPMIPDLRTQTWVKPGDRVMLNFSDYNTGGLKERNFGYGTVLRVTQPASETDEIEVQCKVSPRKWQVEEVSYLLHSPCIIKAEDLRFFKGQPGYTDVWLEFVGCVDPERKLDEETKRAIKEEILRS